MFVVWLMVYSPKSTGKSNSGFDHTHTRLAERMVPVKRPDAISGFPCSLLSDEYDQRLMSQTAKLMAHRPYYRYSPESTRLISTGLVEICQIP